MVRVVRSNPLNETNANIVTILFLVKKGLVKKQQQSDNVGQSLSEPPLTKSWIRPCTLTFKFSIDPKTELFTFSQFPKNDDGKVASWLRSPVKLLHMYTFFFIRTSKLWPSLVVLKFSHNLSLNCS